ncbi:MAG: 2-amino-4-hydroxy-6-hydroxymethyldihydropteridine diphosphokinase [Verrucomicrobiales bacterium]|nr:2-amino-4-hydroxy-6-hydroxymethyldihydropteridine diphosphokinase [Verrucomicrobiales bacterium]MCP5558731.1 2-amino-4-hydroxy-6-hydroxymethyldihydropteridine diphosphokinase [Verrucomicrobiaceae bacterium]
MKDQRTSFGIALGSNVGDALANLQRGVRLLLESVPGVILDGVGGLYETAPVDCAPGTPAFVNSVVGISAPASPQRVHACLIEIETLLGRPKIRAKNEPRTLDLDLLFAGDLVSDDPVLTIPHPRLHERGFVLWPLADFQPDLVLPGQTLSVKALADGLGEDASSIKKLAGPEWVSTTNSLFPGS